MPAKGERLDKELVRRGLYASRARARDAIVRGVVRVNGQVARKPGQPVAQTDAITLEDAARGYVSRAALKLLAALRAEPGLRTAIHGAVCADIGASTGGFTQVLLEHGARKVFAVDVGHGQLHSDIATDARVVNLQGLNARALSRHHLPEPPRVVVSDVSFISLRKALGPVLDLAAPDAWLAALVKPQFEVGPEHVGAGGIVRDAGVREQALQRARRWLEECGWDVRRSLPSPITGADGNVEYLLLARRAMPPATADAQRG